MNHLPSIYTTYCKIIDQLEHPKFYAICAGIGLFISQYVFSQWAFAIGFFIIFIMDTISGTYVAFRRKNFSGKIFRDKLMDKCIAYFTIIISFSAGTKILLEGSDSNLIKYLNVPFYTIFIVIELRSILNKWYAFTNWTWIEKLLEIVDYVPKRKKDQPNQDQ
jgi:hypothetical protein